MEDPLRNFLTIPYPELEELNLAAKEKRTGRAKRNDKELQTYYLNYLKKEKRIKAVTVCFSDIEGRFQMLDYDKKFLLNSYDNLTFDGSSVRGFSIVSQSDLRLKLDWAAFFWLPTDVFGPGKVVVFADIYEKDGTPHPSDFRSGLKTLAEDLYKKEKMTATAAPEIEGFLVEGVDAESEYSEEIGFKLPSTGGYYHSLPKDKLRVFIDAAAEAQRAMGFENEKDHPEVAPSQFELNFKHSEIVNAADQVQLYKLTCRQVAENLGMTATFLPKPAMGINGSGMHVNISINKKGKNLFYDSKGENKISKLGYDFLGRILESANDISLILNPSVNAYRRLDPHFEAPNQIKFSPIDRTSMIRLPLGNENSARIEVRSVAPDTNPYLLFYTLLRTGLDGKKLSKSAGRARTRTLPDNVNDAIKIFKASEWTDKLMGTDSKSKYADLKQASANRCPRDLGTHVKRAEVIYHHEVTNQYLWGKF